MIIMIRERGPKSCLREQMGGSEKQESLPATSSEAANEKSYAPAISARAVRLIRPS